MVIANPFLRGGILAQFPDFTKKAYYGKVKKSEKKEKKTQGYNSQKSR